MKAKKIYIVYASYTDNVGFGQDFSGEWVAGISLTKEGAEKIKNNVIFEYDSEDLSAVMLYQSELQKQNKEKREEESR